MLGQLEVDSPNREDLFRSIVKYGLAVDYACQMAKWVSSETDIFELEISVDETDTATSVWEHLFIALELQRRGVRVISLAPRFVGEFEKGIDYNGDLKNLKKPYTSMS